MTNHYIKAIDSTLRIYYNRPALQNLSAYTTYDEGWQYDNNIDDASLLPENATLQQLDFSSGNCRNLLFYNVFGHKKRFTGLNGGYYNESDATYYTSAGTVSTYAAEFRDVVGGATSTDGYIIDHLTGLGWRAIRGGSGGVNYGNMWVTGINLWGWTDWYIPTINQHKSMVDYEIQAHSNLSVSNNLLAQPPFNYDQTAMNSCTTVKPRPDYYFRFNILYGISEIVLKTATGNGNRVYMRYHYPLSNYVTQP